MKRQYIKAEGSTKALWYEAKKQALRDISEDVPYINNSKTGNINVNIHDILKNAKSFSKRLPRIKTISIS